MKEIIREIIPRQQQQDRKKVRMKFNIPVEKVDTKGGNSTVIDEFKQKRDVRKRKIRTELREQLSAEKYISNIVGEHTEHRKKHFLDYYESKLQKMFPHILLDVNIAFGAEWHKYYNHLKIIERICSTYLALYPVGRDKKFALNFELKEDNKNIVGTFYARKLKGVNEKWIKRVIAPAFSEIRTNLSKFGLQLQYTLEWDLYGNLEEFKFTFAVPKDLQIKRYRNNKVMINR
ncbi:MAG: hypothetical protein H6622_05355 [Halobacteriovoraceae bacterium]|nr:hypothetical protein [Halobacteriovoraceae bacterium]